jgi:hemoglobin-like flavoprotein
MLEDSLYVLAVAAQGGRASPARGALPGIAKRHSREDLDIRPELYDLWLAALLQTVAGCDPEHTPQIEAAWRDTLSAGIEYMRSRY